MINGELARSSTEDMEHENLESDLGTGSEALQQLHTRHLITDTGAEKQFNILTSLLMGLPVVQWKRKMPLSGSTRSSVEINSKALD